MIKKLIRHTKQEIYHRLRLYAIYSVVDKINARFPLKGCSALEAFAYTGELQTRAYKHLPSYLEAWEINPDCESRLKENLPGATIKITNSFEEIKRCNKKFDFINVDTHQGIFGPYCENFEFFPLIFDIANKNCIVNLNVIPSAGAKWRKKYSDLFSEEHLRRRKAFYKTENPESIGLSAMLKVYGEIAEQYGYQIIWHHYKQRTLTYYLSLHLQQK